VDTVEWEPPNEYAGFYFRVGKIDGTAELVAKLLARRFGPLSVEVEGRVGEARLWELHQWGERTHRTDIGRSVSLPVRVRPRVKGRVSEQVGDRSVRRATSASAD
jgi:hypothetical protein